MNTGRSRLMAVAVLAGTVVAAIVVAVASLRYPAVLRLPGAGPVLAVTVIMLLGYAADGLRRGDDVGSPATQSEIRLLLFRLIGANEDDRQLLRAASVLGPRFRVSVAGQMAGLAGRRAIAALDRLTRAGLIRGGECGWAQFSHELVRQAVYDELAPPVRAQLHELAFRALVAYSPSQAEAAGQALAALRDTAEAKRLVSELEDRATREPIPAFGISIIHHTLGDDERAGAAPGLCATAQSHRNCLHAYRLDGQQRLGHP